jgi:hypothetical protein
LLRNRTYVHHPIWAQSNLTGAPADETTPPEDPRSGLPGSVASSAAFNAKACPACPTCLKIRQHSNPPLGSGSLIVNCFWCVLVLALPARIGVGKLHPFAIHLFGQSATNVSTSVGQPADWRGAADHFATVQFVVEVQPDLNAQRVRVNRADGSTPLLGHRPSGDEWRCGWFRSELKRWRVGE